MLSNRLRILQQISTTAELIGFVRLHPSNSAYNFGCVVRMLEAICWHQSRLSTCGYALPRLDALRKHVHVIPVQRSGRKTDNLKVGSYYFPAMSWSVPASLSPAHTPFIQETYQLHAMSIASTALTASLHPLGEMNLGTVTSWLPASTPFSSPPKAGAIEIYTAGGIVVGWSPYFSIFVSSLNCWHNQLATGQLMGSTVASLASLVCLDAYTTTVNSVVDGVGGRSTFVGCCPS
jgi:hypothetical protein